MMRWFKALLSKFRQLILYGIIGSFSASLDFCVYTLLIIYVGFPYLFANFCSVLIGIACSFCLNRNYNFKVKDRVKSRFVLFLTVGLCGLLLSNLILYVCVEELTINKMFSKFLSIVLVVIFQFLANKMITFRPSNK